MDSNQLSLLRSEIRVPRLLILRRRQARATFGRSFRNAHRLYERCVNGDHLDIVVSDVDRGKRARKLREALPYVSALSFQRIATAQGLLRDGSN